MAMVILAVIVPFFKSRGLGMEDVFFVQAFFSLMLVILEVPSGYFSDLLGRRRTLIIGTS